MKSKIKTVPLGVLILALAYFLPQQHVAVAQDFNFHAVDQTTSITNKGVTAASVMNTAVLFTPTSFLNVATNGDATQPNGLATFNAIDVAAGDFNGDGLLDAAAISSDSAAPGTGNRITVLLGAGDGTFGFPIVSTLGTKVPTSIVVGDIDLDGRADVVVGESCPVGEGGCVDGVIIINGDVLTTGGALTVNGSLVQRISFPTPPGQVPVSVALGRLNNDAFPDIAVALTGGSVGVATQAGDGTFGNQTAFPTSGNITQPAVRAIAIGQSNLISEATPDQDIFVATQSGVEIFENQVTATGTFLSGAAPGNGVLAIPAGNLPVGVVITDVATADGKNDVIALNRGSGTVSTFIANAGTGYGAAVNSSVGGTNPVSFAALKFIFTFGAVDLVVVNNTGVVNNSSINVLQGSTTTPGAFTLGGFNYTASSGLPIFSPNAVATGRFDVRSAVAPDDILTGEGISPGNFSPGGVILQDNQASYRARALELTSNMSRAVDFDGNDGANDIAIIEQETGTVFILLNIGSGTPATTLNNVNAINFFIGGPQRVIPTSVTSFKGANGRNNIAITNVDPFQTGTTNQILVGLNDGTGNFQDPFQFRQFTASSGATNIQNGDFNNDGIDDLSYIDFNSNFAAVTLNDGTDFFLTPQFRETGGFVPVSSTLGDFNDDDALDMAVLSQGSISSPTQSIVSILLGNGDGTLSSGPILNVPNFGLSIVGGVANFETNNIPRIVDFNQDGFPDLAVVSTRGGTEVGGSATPSVTLLLNRPDSPGNFNVSAPIALIDDTQVGTAGVLQLEDIFGGPGLVSGRSAPFAPNTTVGTGGANYVLAVGDFNADGSPDLVASGASFLNPLSAKPVSARSSIYLFGNETAGTVRVSKPLRNPALVNIFDTNGSYSALGTTSELLVPFNGGDTFVAAATGQFSALPNLVPDVVHLSLNGNIWVDQNQTSILNHAPVVTVRREDLNAPLRQGRKVVINSGQSANIPVNATDVDSDTLRFRLVAVNGEMPPSFVSITDNGNNTASININSDDVNRGPGNH